jgi:hypothetical protein
VNASARGVRIATAVGAAGLAVLGFAPGVASAANSDSLTVAGGSSYTYTFNQSPSIKAVAQPNCLSHATPITLSISGPGVTDPLLASAKRDCFNPVSLSPSDSEVNTAHPGWSGGVMAMNGVYTVTLNNEGRTTSVTFTLLIPPAKPRGFAVSTSGTQATFDWIANAEPDVTSYRITDASGRTIASPTNACSSGSCTTGPIDFGKSAAGHTEKFSIVAVRSCGTASCNGGHLDSPSAATASGTFPVPPPTPTPTPTPTSSGSPGTPGSPTPGTGSGGSGSPAGGSGGGGAGGTSTGGGALAGSTGGKQQHKHTGTLPALSAGVLPALDAPALPGIETRTRPLQLGKPGGKIAYPAPVVAQKRNLSAVRSITHDIRTSLSKRPLWQGIAAAAVLLLIAVHLRTWASRETY